MPRIRRKGFARRSAEIPLEELSLADLEAENHRLHQVLFGREDPRPDSEEDDPWHLLHRTGELMSEIRRRKAIDSTNKTQTIVTSIEDAKCRDE